MATMPLYKRLLLGILVTFVLVCVYFLAAQVNFGRNVSLLTELDRMIPFLPQAVWIYASFVPVLLGLPFVIEQRQAFLEVAESIGLATVLSAVIFVLVPSAYPRPTVEVVDWSTWLLAKMYLIDPPNNTFPSLHVSLSFVVAITLYREMSRTLGKALLVWALLVSASTVLVKQHYILDVFAGFFVAALSCWSVAKDEFGDFIRKTV